MNSKFLFIIAFITMTTTSIAQTNTWDKCKWLIGDWVGEGSGKPGEGKGWFSLKEDLSGKVLVRKNHSEYPAANGKPETIHDDLMIIYTDNNGDPSKAVYFDNEGHNINYSISYTGTTIIFMSDKIPNAPVFRLTYTAINTDTVGIKFEMSQDGEKFMTYTDGKCSRKK